MTNEDRWLDNDEDDFAYCFGLHALEAARDEDLADVDLTDPDADEDAVDRLIDRIAWIEALADFAAESEAHRRHVRRVVAEQGGAN